MWKKWIQLLCMMPAGGLIFLDSTILPVALPTIQEQMDASNIALQWCVDAYLLAMTIFVLLGGKLADRIGPKNSYLVGMSLFTLASLFCGMSPNILFLILARGGQGIGAALLFPSLISLITKIFSSEERGRAMGVNASVCSLFLVLGPLIGGYLTQMVTWGWIFYVNVPVGLIGLFLVWKKIPSFAPALSGPIDTIGFCYSLLGATSLVTFFLAWQHFEGPSFVLGSLILFAIFAFFLLWKREKSVATPLLALSLFRIAPYRSASLSISYTQFLLMITVYWTIYCQQVLELSPIETGQWILCSALPVLFIAPIAGWASDKISPKVPLVFGFFCLIFAALWLAFFRTGDFFHFLPGLAAFGIGIPAILTPSFSSAVNSVPPRKMGIAAGQLSMLRFLGGSMGVAVLGMLLNWRTEVALHSALSREGLSTEAYGGISLYGAKALEALPSSLQSTLSELLKEARVEGFFEVHLFLASLSLFVFGLVFISYQGKWKHQVPSSPAEGWD